MKRKRIYIKIISLIVVGVFLHQQIVWAQGNVAGLDKAAPSLSQPVVSNELAQVDRTQINGSKETIINIQDAHSSLSAQYSIVDILKELAANYNLSVVAIEGGTGYIDTSILRSLPNEEIREKTARFLMKEGKISAGEFFSATQEEAVALYGVEDNDLYQKNLKIFRDIHKNNRENISVLKTLLKKLRASEETIYSKDLAKFTYKSRLHREGKISFDVYWSYLDELCKVNSITIKEFKNIESFNNTVELERSIDFSKATSERKELIDEVMQNINIEDTETLVKKSLSFEKGQIDQAEYHIWLLEMAKKRYMDTGRFMELGKFVDYVDAYRNLNVIGLSLDLEDIETEVLKGLIRDQKERDLYELTRTAELLKSLFEIKLTDEDVIHLESIIEQLNTDNFSKFTKSEEPLEKVIDDAKDALEFYRIAGERNSAMLSNTVQAMRREGKTMAALISGGHHSYGLTELMKEKGLSYLVLMPKAFKDEERPYVAILTKKSGPYRELVKTGDYDLALEAYMDTGDFPELEELFVYSIVEFVKSGESVEDNIEEWCVAYEEDQRGLSEIQRNAMAFKPAGVQALRAYLKSIKVEKIHSGSYDVAIRRNIYNVTDEEVKLIDFSGKAIKEPLKISDIERLLVRYDAIRSAVLTAASHGISARALSFWIPAIAALMPIIKTMSARPEIKKEALAEKGIMAPGDDIFEVKVPTILEAATMNIEKAAKIMEMDPALKKILLTPVSVTEAGFEISLEDSGVIKMWAFRVLQNDALGPGKGGLRWLIVKGETLEEAKKMATGLATLMSVKNSGVGIPYGGGKGDIVIDEEVNNLLKGWGDEEVQAALNRDKEEVKAIRAKSDRLKARIIRGFSRALTEKKAVGTFIDVPAPDMGTDSRMMAWFCDEHLRVLTERGVIYDKVLEGFLKTVTPDESDPCATAYLDRCLSVLEADTEGAIQGVEIGVVTGKPVGKGGSEGRTKATGFGGFLALGDVMEYFAGLRDINKHHIGRPLKEGVKKILKRNDLEGVSVGIQGTGNVGEYNAWEFYNAKAKITLLQDVYCTLYAPKGIDLKLLDEELERLPDGRWASLATISQEFLEKTGYTLTEDKFHFWETYTNIKVPAAKQNQITAANAGKVAENCEIILELANNPTSPLADEALRKAGVLVIPDVMANAGGVTVSYFEWLQNIEGRYHNEKSIDKMLEERVSNEVIDVMRIAVKFRVDMRIGAYILSLARIANAEIARRAEKGTLQLVGKVPYKYYGKLELAPMTVEGLRRKISGPDKLISKQKRTPGFIKLVEKSEKKHSQQIREVTAAISRRFDKKRRGFVMLSGAPTSGKMAVSERVVSALKKNGRPARKIDIDLQVDEHIERMRLRGVSPEMLHKIRTKKALQFLKKLRDSDAEPMDILVLEEGEIKTVKFQIVDNEILVLEGDYTLSDEIMDKKTGPLRNEQTFGIFVNVAPTLKLENNWPLTSLDLRFMRQILTFTKLFGQDILYIIRAWPDKRADSIKYTYPTWKNADFTFNSYLPYELPVLKTHIEPLLRDALKRVDRAEAMKAIKHLLFILKGVPAVEAGDIIPKDSIIRQFIGKSEKREQSREAEVRAQSKFGNTKIQVLVAIGLVFLAMHSVMAATVVAGVVIFAAAAKYVSSVIFKTKTPKKPALDDVAVILKENIDDLMGGANDFRKRHVKSVIRHFEALRDGDFDVFLASIAHPAVSDRTRDEDEYFELLAKSRDIYSSLTKKEQDALYLGAILHDIGYTQTPDDLGHPIRGAEICETILREYGVQDEEVISNVKDIVLYHTRLPDVGASWLLSDFPEGPESLRKQLLMITILDAAGKINRKWDSNFTQADEDAPSQMESSILSAQFLGESLDMFERFDSITHEEFLNLRFKYGCMKRPFQLSNKGLELNKGEIDYLKSKGAEDPVLTSMWSHHIRNSPFPLFKALKEQGRKDYPQRLLKLMMLVAYATGWYLGEQEGYDVLTLEIEGDDYSDEAFLRILENHEGLFRMPFEAITNETVVEELERTNARSVFGVNLRFEGDRILLSPKYDPEIVVGLPKAIYQKLSETSDMEQLEEALQKESGISRIVPIEEASEKDMVKYLSREIKGPFMGVLIDADVTKDIDANNMMPELKGIINDFVKNTKEEMLSEINKNLEAESAEDITEVITQKTIESANDIKSLARLVVRVLPEGMSYNLSEISLRDLRVSQIRLEERYARYQSLPETLPARKKYEEAVIINRDNHFLIHFADGEEIGNPDAPAVVPPGLEIINRREKHGVTIENDPNKDKFFVVVPKDKDKEAFKKEIMELWMLEGVVGESDVVILDRIGEGYETSHLFPFLSTEDGLDVDNMGIRVMTAGLWYDEFARDFGLLQVDIALDAKSTLDQYEAFVSLLLMKKEDRIRHTPEGLEKLEDGRYIYIRKAQPVDFEEDVKRYYYREVKQVLIKA